MSKREIEAAVRAWQRRLGLEGWEITFDWSARQNDADASVWRARDYDRATLWFSPEFLSWDRRRGEIHVVHELLHLMLRDLELIVELAEAHVHPAALGVLRDAHMHHVEQAIERLAIRLVDLEASV